MGDFKALGDKKTNQILIVIFSLICLIILSKWFEIDLQTWVEIAQIVAAVGAVGAVIIAFRQVNKKNEEILLQNEILKKDLPPYLGIIDEIEKEPGTKEIKLKNFGGDVMWNKVFSRLQSLDNKPGELVENYLHSPRIKMDNHIEGLFAHNDILILTVHFGKHQSLRYNLNFEKLMVDGEFVQHITFNKNKQSKLDRISYNKNPPNPLL